MPDLGPLVLSAGKEPVKLDIIFVHGLGGNRLRTWTQEDILWPRDLLPEDRCFPRLSHARMITWGYDADVARFFEQQSHESIYNHAESLLDDIASLVRRTAEERARPVVFVGHSLGGLVVKQAMCTGLEWMHTGRNRLEAALCQSVKGIIFMGTPHRGSSQADWSEISRRLVSMLGKATNSDLVDSLRPGKPFLDNLQHRFAGFQDHIPIVTALETQGVHKIGKIVEDHSAKLHIPGEKIIYIPGDHRTMCKFSNADEIGYQRVAGSLERLMDHIELELAQSSRTLKDLTQPQVGATSDNISRHRTLPDPAMESWEAANAEYVPWDSDEEIIGLRRTTKSVFATASHTSTALLSTASQTSENLIGGVRRLGLGVGSRMMNFAEGVSELFDSDEE